MQNRTTFMSLAIILLALPLPGHVPVGLGQDVALAGQEGQTPQESDQKPDETKEGNEAPKGFPPPKGLTPVHPDSQAWIDIKRKLVVVDGRVAMREGLLEMFACPQGTKEHESIIAVHGKAWHVHAGLLAVGATAGHPARFSPVYEPAQGTLIDIWVLWKDADGKKQRVRAQSWIRDVDTEKEMKHDWVFAGSSFWRDPTTKVDYYQGDGGDFICVSNFPTATLDLPVESTQGNDGLLFEAFTERIPPRDTPVRLVLVPRQKVAEKAVSVEAKDPNEKEKPGTTDPPDGSDKKQSATKRTEN